jgi:hypothetical protein
MSNTSPSSVPLMDRPESSRKISSLSDSALIVEQICKMVTEATRQIFGTSSHAVILTGSLARNEGSIQRSDLGRWKVQGDAEFLILLAAESAFPRPRDVEATVLQIEAQLIQQGVECSLSLSYCHEDFFRTMTPHMFAYETRVLGKVVSGEFDALSLIPPFTPSEIPVEDAWRTLTNRMIELAEAMAAHKNPERGQVPASIAYRTMKLTLDTATSVLLFHGRYAPTYRQRAANLCQFASAPDAFTSLKISTGEFARAVTFCTEWKLTGEEPAGIVTWDWVRATCERALAVWIWELQQLAGTEDAASISRQITDAARKQAWSSRIRGWLYVMRGEGWLRSVSYWPRWAAMGLRATPRYWTYEATGLLFARINEYVGAGSDATSLAMNLSVESVSKSDLPLWLSGTKADAKDWRDFARAVAWNYHRYLEGTRA